MPRQFETPEGAAGPFRLGQWLVEPRLNRLTRDGESIQIELKIMDVLVCLAEHAGDLVERQELIDTVWATEFISENILTRAVAELRSALGDDVKAPSYIETIHRRGCRLVAEVTPIEASVLAESKAVVAFKLEGDGGDHTLHHGENVIGRSDDADISIDVSDVSRWHARILVSNTAATVEDLGSKNGTFLNGMELDSPKPLESGDEIRIGRDVARFRFVIEGDATVTERFEP